MKSGDIWFNLVMNKFITELYEGCTDSNGTDTNNSLLVTTHQDNVWLVDPDLLPQLSANVTKPFDAVEAHGLQATVAQHFRHLLK